MKTNNQGWDYCGNAQAVVAGKGPIRLACDVVPDSHDKHQAAPLARQALANLEQAGLDRPVDAHGQAVPLPDLTDPGDYSEQAAPEVATWGLDPYMATGRQKPHEATPAVVAATAAAATTAAATAKEQRTAKLRTAAGRALYALRKTLVEPVFGQITGARGSRRFLLRGLAKVRGEWRLLCVTHNLLKLWRSRCAPSGVCRPASGPGISDGDARRKQTRAVRKHRLILGQAPRDPSRSDVYCRPLVNPSNGPLPLKLE
jgi:hypothetical protein